MVEAIGSHYINNSEKKTDTRFNNIRTARRKGGRRENRRRRRASAALFSPSTRRLMSTAVAVSFSVSVGGMGMSSSLSPSIGRSSFIARNMYGSCAYTTTTTTMPSIMTTTRSRRLIATTTALAGLPPSSRYHSISRSSRMMDYHYAPYTTTTTTTKLYQKNCRFFFLLRTLSSSSSSLSSMSTIRSNPPSSSSSVLRNSLSSSSSSQFSEEIDEATSTETSGSSSPDLIETVTANTTTSDTTTTTKTSSNPFATTYHAPVMWEECIDALLECERGRERRRGRQNDNDGDDDDDDSNESDEVVDPSLLIFVDGTLGGGGHSEALLAKLHAGDVLFGCDVDPNALKTASDRLQQYMDHDLSERPLFVPVQTNFCDISTKLPTIEYPPSAPPSLRGKRIIENASSSSSGRSGDRSGVDGILLDLGVSSHQIDEPERGFSFMKDRDGPLDMRMSAGDGSSTTSSSSSGMTAADIVNEFDATELQKIFSRYGDEPRAKTIAGAIVKHRPMTTTGQLVDAIASVTPKFAKNKRKGRTATCARIFQSLRIVVNNEDGVLDRVLSEACPTLLRPGGRLVVLSYHSMEDRATKRIMRDGTLNNDELRRQRRNPFEGKDMYGNYVGPVKPFKPVGKRRRATEQEIDENPRARSATLRVAERQPNQQQRS